jgi:2-methylisocitrate lyase-like PEP mutase family enzyme
MTTARMSQADKGSAFRAMHHAAAPLVVPNPWDPGTARLCADLGFKALATTSAGTAYSLGRPDAAGAVTRDEALTNAKLIVDAVDLPVTADLENLYAHEPEAAAATIPMAAATGLVGCSIEDASGRAGDQIYAFDLAVERVRAAVAAARALPFPFTLAARAENFLHGVRDLDDTIRRLQAYAAAGADVVYAPGLPDRAAIRRVIQSVAVPVNILVSKGNADLTVAELTALGARRISVGGSLYRAAIQGFIEGAEEIVRHGTFTYGGRALAASEIEKRMRGAGS